MKRWIVAALLAFSAGALLLTGCGGPPKKPVASNPKPKKVAPAAPPPKPKPQVAANAFPNVPAALKEMETACEDLRVALKDNHTDAERKATQRIRTATDWCELQGGAAVSLLWAELKKGEMAEEYRLSVTRALGQIGEPATAALQDACYSDARLVRMRAVKELGGIKPPKKETVDLLMRLLSDDNGQIRQLAIQSLGSLGPAAKDAGPKLNEILNSDANDTERDYAAKALKAVNPRKTFQD